MPSKLRDDIRQYQETRSTKKISSQKIVGHLNNWILTNIDLSIKSIQENLKSIMPLSLSDRVSWNQKKKLYASSSAVPIKAIAFHWNTINREIFVLQFETLKEYTKNTSYYVSSTPIFLFKENKNTKVMDLKSWKYAKAGSHIYTIHGLIWGNRSWPDVLFSTGPVGSGNIVYFAQLHNSGQELAIVWEFNKAHVIEASYEEVGNLLTIKYAPEKFTNQIESQSFSLEPGGFNQ